MLQYVYFALIKIHITYELRCLLSFLFEFRHMKMGFSIPLDVISFVRISTASTNRNQPQLTV